MYTSRTQSTLQLPLKLLVSQGQQQPKEPWFEPEPRPDSPPSGGMTVRRRPLPSGCGYLQPLHQGHSGAPSRVGHHGHSSFCRCCFFTRLCRPREPLKQSCSTQLLQRRRHPRAQQEQGALPCPNSLDVLWAGRVGEQNSVLAPCSPRSRVRACTLLPPGPSRCHASPLQAALSGPVLLQLLERPKGGQHASRRAFFPVLIFYAPAVASWWERVCVLLICRHSGRHLVTFGKGRLAVLLLITVTQVVVGICLSVL